MTNVAGRGTGRRATTGASTQARAGTARGRGPSELALTDLVRGNDVDVELDTTVTTDGRLDYDDFPDGDLTPDLGQPDDDEPFGDEPNERLPALRTRPEILLWEGPAGIEWEVRPTSETLLADAELAGIAVRRERLLERYAAGLTTEMVSRGGRQGLATASLIDIWDQIPTRSPVDPHDGTRWNTQAAIGQRWGVDVSTLSRDRTVLVSLPAGHVVPLQFFMWKTENDALVEAITRADTLFSTSITSVAKSVTLQPRAQRSAKDYVPWVRAVRRHGEVVRCSQDQFRSFPARYESTLDWLRQSLSEAELDRTRLEGGSPLGKQDRSLPVLHRAVVGGI